jgi:capsular polysaccharide biosynthesis protein
MDKQNTNSTDFSLLDLWMIIVNNLLFIISVTLICFILTFVYVSYIVTPNYISNADVMIQVEQDSSSNSNNFDLVNAFRLIDTVAELMKKDIILENSVERLRNLGYEELSANYLREGLVVRSSSSSYFINISFVDQNTLLAKDAVDAIIESTIEVTDIENAFPVLTDKIRRTSFASDSIYFSPNKALFSFFGLAFGLFLSAGIVIARELFSTRFKSKEEIEEALGLQVIGIIPLKEVRIKTNGKN